MKALVYHGPGQIAWEERPRPIIQDPGDVIVRISKTTICGTDLAILKGGVPTATPGRIIGHEATAYIEEVGPAVSDLKVGDHVIIPCTSSCGRCAPCRKGLYSSCVRGGWQLGNTIDGVQAEYARIPLADSSLHRIPPTINEEAALMLADIIPTGLEVGVLKSEVGLGDTVAVIGAGPVGLATVMAAQFFSPARTIVIDIDENRLALARTLGATHTVNNRNGDAYEQVMTITDGVGVDVAIEVIGNPATCQLAQDIIGSGGRMANIGIYSKSVELHKEVLWTRNITIRMGVVNTSSIPVLIKMIQACKLDPSPLISHHFRLDEIVHAYDIFRNAAQEQAIKIVLTNTQAIPAAPAAFDEQSIRQIVAQVLAKM
ncbi:MAG: zinc-dependent alcohol dehydrogenase family protein [Oscillochloris sp.]|nr:zinc-dependent alcohol dehydrogenase family protein [Oscillochloris sp.]